MAIFAQQNYGQHLGNSSAVTIAQEGCLLTSICNGLQKINGSGPDPATLNQFFISHGVYTFDNVDKAADDLSYNSVTSYDPTIVVSATDTSQVPSNALAIVVFHYQSVSVPTIGGQPNMINHYCWVDHIENGQVFIIDSWDGQVKGPNQYESVYHLPVAWATFTKIAPAPQHPFTVQPLNPTEQLITTQACCSYDLDYPTDVDQHPYTGYVAGTRLEAVASAFHQNGKKYFMTDATGVEGFYEGDVDYYHEPTPPASPVAPPAPPSAPVKGTPTEKYVLLCPVPYFSKASDALNVSDNTPAAGTLSAKSYIVWERDTNLGMINLTDDNTKNKNWWINPLMNVPPKPKEEIKPNVTVTSASPTQAISQSASSSPVVVSTATDTNLTVANASAVHNNPTSWKATLAPLSLDRSVYWMKSRNLQDVYIYDLDGTHEPIIMPAHHDVPLVATFEKDGILYGRTQQVAKNELWYGVPMSILDADHDLYALGKDALAEFKARTAHTYGKVERLIQDITRRKR